MSFDALRRHQRETHRFSRMKTPSLRGARAAAAATVIVAAPLAVRAQSTATLTATERSIAGAVDSHNAEALALLERLVNINSGTLNIAGVKQVADALRPPLEALG